MSSRTRQTAHKKVIEDFVHGIENIHPCHTAAILDMTYVF